MYTRNCELQVKTVVIPEKRVYNFRMEETKRGPGRPPVREKTQEARIQLRTLDSEKVEFERAAEFAGITLSQWMRDRLNRAAKRENRRAR